MVSFPCRHGGLRIVVPTTLNHQYTTSKTITAPLVERICSQAPLGDSLDCVRSAKRKLSAANRRSMKSNVLDFLAAAPAELSYSGKLASQPGASSWLTCRPMKHQGFALTKGEFRDGIALRYGWPLTGLPSNCATPYLAQRVAFQHCATMRYVTSPPACSGEWQNFPLRWSLIFSQSLVSGFAIGRQYQLTRHGLTLWQAGCGADGLNAAFLM